jgi:hypothetical protein
MSQTKELNLAGKVICEKTFIENVTKIINTSPTDLIIIIIIIISEIVAAQHQVYYATKILYTETDSKCRPCQQLDETIDHTISACPILAKEQYIKRHDKVSAQIHFNIC